MPFLKVKRSGFEKLKAIAMAPSDRALAKLMDVEPATLSRVLRGKTQPRGGFIAGAVSLGVRFEDLFEIWDQGDHQ